MQYEGIILELLGRIKTLEAQYQDMSSRITELETEVMDCAVSAEPAAGEPAAEGQEPEGRRRLTGEMAAACYDCGRRLYENPELPFGTALNDMAAQTGMNRNSAIMYVYAVRNMLKGEIYKRSISLKATELFFQYILRDDGKAGLRRAIDATRLHIAYRRQFGHMVDGLERLCGAYAARLGTA